MKKIVVLYHANCPDGFGAAWAAWKKFGGKAEYIGIRPDQGKNQLSGLLLKDRDIYFLDVSASGEVLRGLVKQNKSVTVIDHHLSNRDVVQHASRFLFDLHHSGAVLAWQYFFPHKTVPWLLRYLQEMDLWKFRLPNTMEIITWLGLFPFEFKAWDTLVKSVEKTVFRKRVIAEGKLLLKYEDRLITRILKYAQEVQFRGYRARAVNSPQFQSQIGHLLIDKKHPVGIVWSVASDGIKFSLRSNGKVDVSRLAKQFPGGGGHKRAAGFSLPLNKKFPWKVLKK